MGVKPEVYEDELPEGLGGKGAIVVCTVGGKLGEKFKQNGGGNGLKGQWESYQVSAVGKELIVMGSDKVSETLETFVTQKVG